MLSKPLIFYARILTTLFVLITYFPKTAPAQQLDVSKLIELPIPNEEANNITIKGGEFVVYGRAPSNNLAGIEDDVVYQQVLEDGTEMESLPDLEIFFLLGGTLELLTTDTFYTKHAIVISEIMWGRDTSYRTGDHPEPQPDDPSENPDFTTYTQWIELYNPTSQDITSADLYLFFTPFVSYPDRKVVVDDDGKAYHVLDAVSTLHLGKWELPGRTGRRPTTNVVSAYRDIVYVKDSADEVPFGSHESSWQETQEDGRRNTLISVSTSSKVVRLPYIATPGAPHVRSVLLEPHRKITVDADQIVINEVRNDISSNNLDWVELKNVGRSTVQLRNWELSIVTGIGKDDNLADLPDYTMAAGEILLIQREHPYFSTLVDGIDIADLTSPATGAIHKYVIAPNLRLPNTEKFTLLLRSENDKNGEDAAIEDYAGNGFFLDASPEFSTDFWPRRGQPLPTDIADFGLDPTFGSVDSAWARVRYNKDDGHHKDAWEKVGTQGGIGYVANADQSLSPGTPGYENDAFKTRIDDRNPRTPPMDSEYNDGAISISEIMSDPGPNRNGVQWIELYNSSMTQAISLESWELEIRNLEDEEGRYVDGSFEFDDATILPNQTLLLVSESAATDVPSNRVYDLYRRHRRELGLTRRSHLLLSPTAFYLKLTDKADPNWSGDDVVVDEVGNLKVERITRTKVWDLPEVDSERRRSILRLYGNVFKPNQGGLDGRPSPPDNGLSAAGWRRFSVKGQSLSFYGLRDDLASPGYRLGGPLPVTLSSFRPVRMKTGAVLIRWTTESELNNAGFNILRSETKNGTFKVVNVKGIIPGHGTTSERHTYEWADTSAKPNIVYYYQIEDVSLDGNRTTLAMTHLHGNVRVAGKATTTWGDLKLQK